MLILMIQSWFRVWSAFQLISLRKKVSVKGPNKAQTLLEKNTNQVSSESRLNPNSRHFLLPVSATVARRSKGNSSSLTTSAAAWAAARVASATVAMAAARLWHVRRRTIWGHRHQHLRSCCHSWRKWKIWWDTAAEEEVQLEEVRKENYVT